MRKCREHGLWSDEYRRLGLTYDYVVMFKYQYHLLVISNSILSFIQYHLFLVLTQLTFNFQCSISFSPCSGISCLIEHNEQLREIQMNTI